MTLIVRLSSKGQLVIPGVIRKELRLEPGARFQLDVVGRKIILEPLADRSPIDVLYGMLRGEDLLADLAREHREEIDGE